MKEFVPFRPTLRNPPPIPPPGWGKWGVREMGGDVIHQPHYTEFEAQWLANFHTGNPEATAQTGFNELELYQHRITEAASKPPDLREYWEANLNLPPESRPVFPGWGHLPPARPVTVTEADLVLAVRRLYLEFGKVNQSKLLTFIIKVLANETPETSLDPQPLIVALQHLAASNYGRAAYIADKALSAYEHGQELTIEDVK